MKWFMEAEGSRNYEDEATMNELLRKLDTNGDGKVAPPKSAVYTQEAFRHSCAD
jgi:hypothetical protein